MARLIPILALVASMAALGCSGGESDAPAPGADPAVGQPSEAGTKSDAGATRRGGLEGSKPALKGGG